jgi:hypothetical protein
MCARPNFIALSTNFTPLREHQFILEYMIISLKRKFVEIQSKRWKALIEKDVCCTLGANNSIIVLYVSVLLVPTSNIQ